MSRLVAPSRSLATMMIKKNSCLFWTLLAAQVLSCNSITPSWKELDNRPNPSWYDEAKFGIFIHWGVFSVPSFTSEWFWNYWQSMGFEEEKEFVAQTERPGFVYQEYAHRFKAEFFNATEWADIFAQAGAQYVVLTSKHHEGK